MQELYQKAINKWGLPIQIIIAIEELAELQKELTKELRYCTNSDTIAEEIADVEIVTEQLKLIFDNYNKVSEIKAQKLIRLKELINKD